MSVVVPYEKDHIEKADRLFKRAESAEARLSEALDLLRWYGKNTDLPPTVTQPALDFIARIEKETNT